MSGYWAALFVVGFAVAGSMYALALRWRRMALVDLIWTAGVGIAAAAYVSAHELYHARALLVLAVVSLWSLRLTVHLFCDRVRSGDEDPRYVNLAKHWGPAARRNFFGLFLLQIVFVALFILPVSTALQHRAAVSWLDGLALTIALVAFLGESIADRQLARFRADTRHATQVCQEGLWRYSRHPNYFFEWVHWWAYVAFAWGSPQSWVAWIGPVAMYIFLRYLTGIPYAERSSLQRRGEAYRQYQYTTQAFFLWKPRTPPS